MEIENAIMELATSILKVGILIMEIEDPIMETDISTLEIKISIVVIELSITETAIMEKDISIRKINTSVMEMDYCKSTTSKYRKRSIVFQHQQIKCSTVSCSSNFCA